MHICSFYQQQMNICRDQRYGWFTIKLNTIRIVLIENCFSYSKFIMPFSDRFTRFYVPGWVTKHFLHDDEYTLVWSYRRLTSASRLWYDFDFITTFHRLCTDRNRHVRWKEIQVRYITWIVYDECSFHVNKARLWYECRCSHSTISLLTQIKKKMEERNFHVK